MFTKWRLSYFFTGRKKRRIQFQKQSLLKVVPNAEEQKVIHNTFLQTVDLRDPTIHKRVLPSNSMWMDEVSYSSIIFGQPEVPKQKWNMYAYNFHTNVSCSITFSVIHNYIPIHCYTIYAVEKESLNKLRKNKWHKIETLLYCYFSSILVLFLWPTLIRGIPQRNFTQMARHNKEESIYLFKFCYFISVFLILAVI
jgi:hypothetical protein